MKYSQINSWRDLELYIDFRPCNMPYRKIIEFKNKLIYYQINKELSNRKKNNNTFCCQITIKEKRYL